MDNEIQCCRSNEQGRDESFGKLNDERVIKRNIASSRRASDDVVDKQSCFLNWNDDFMLGGDFVARVYVE